MRQISNTSTGSLAACIYEALSDYLAAPENTLKSGEEFMVHYVLSKTAVKPEVRENLPVTFYPVSDVKSVEAVLEKLLADHKIGYVIHAMAVSDFTKDYLIEREALIGALTGALEKALDVNREALAGEKLRSLIRETIEHPAGRLDDSAKVRSTADLILALKRTPKLIEKIKKWSPASCLVGFKLLKDVSEAELIRVAAELSEKNGCDFVLANDMNNIRADRHEGLLLQGRNIAGRYGTKKEIAAGLVRHMLGRAESGEAKETGAGQ